MRKDFTLVELIIVMIVIGVLSALALAPYRAAQQSTLERELKSVLKFVQAREEVRYEEIYTYVNCTDVPDCNARLSLALPQDLTLFVQDANDIYFCAQSSKGGLTFHIEPGDSVAQDNACP